MRSFLSTIFLSLLLPCAVKGQFNILPNPGFEDTASCPTNYGQVTSACKDWRSFTSSSPDYLHSCNSGNLSVPNNYAGQQTALSGNAYCGIMTHYTPVAHYEYITAHIPALQPGGMYQMSLAVSRGSFALATNNIGIFFYDTGMAFHNTTGLLTDTPQIHFYSLGTLTDTANWILLSKTFVADSAYDNIVIGPYNDPSNTYDIDTIGTGQLYAYYYIDDVALKRLDTFYLELADTLLCVGDTVNVPYVAFSNAYSSTNTFTIELSDSFGNFGMPITIGSIQSDTSGVIQCVIPNVWPGTQYRMRGTSNSPNSFSITFGKNIMIGNSVPSKPVATSNSPVCSNDTLELYATSSSQNVSYKWVGPYGFVSYMQNPTILYPSQLAIGDYIVSARSFGCTSEDTVDVNIINMDDIFINDTLIYVCANDTLSINTTAPTGTTFSWTGPGNFLSTVQSPKIYNVTNTAAGTYIVTASFSGCTTKDSVVVTVKPLPADFSASSNSAVCYYDTARLFANTTTSSGVTYSWAGPNSYSSTLKNPYFAPALYSDTGSYIVTATLNGCQVKDTAHLTLKESPGIVTAGNNGPLCEPDTLKLTAGSSTTNAVSYSWAGPNSFTSNNKNPEIGNTVPGTSGTYTVTASYNGCSFVKSTSVTIKPVPVFTATSNSPLCTGDNINFSASSSFSGVSYAWTGPNSFNSTSATPFILNVWGIHTGNYFATATMNGCNYYDTVAVLVKPLPDKPVANSNSPLCAGQVLYLTSSSTTSGVSYSWIGPNSYSSSNQNPTISTTTTVMSGDYVVIANLNGCNRKDTTTVLVKPKPQEVTLSNNSPACAGDTLKLFSTSSTTGAGYTWTGPAGFNTGTQNAVIANASTAAAGWYKMTVNLNGCLYIDSTNAMVHPIPATPNITFSSPLCLGETLNLGTGAVAGAVYSWSGPNSFSSSSQSPIRSNMQYSDTGMYTLNVTVNGCISPRDSEKIYLNPTPFVVIQANPADSVCQGKSVMFTAIPSNHGGTPTYQWYVNGQTAGTGTVFSTTTLNDQDIVRCGMTENTKCSVPYTDQSNDVTMTVVPVLAPSVTITANPNRPLKGK